VCYKQIETERGTETESSSKTHKQRETERERRQRETAKAAVTHTYTHTHIPPQTRSSELGIIIEHTHITHITHTHTQVISNIIYCLVEWFMRLPYVLLRQNEHLLVSLFEVLASALKNGGTHRIVKVCVCVCVCVCVRVVCVICCVFVCVCSYKMKFLMSCARMYHS